ncbi:hypothetical protein BX616_009781 [Lobosporangium transversale]|nr:hypothetical protein BX616_009781 [Lobosporangium transversale]
MGMSLREVVMAVLPLTSFVVSASICAIAAKSTNIELNPAASPSRAAQLARRKSTFDYTRIPVSNNASDNISGDTQPKAHHIKIRTIILFLFSLLASTLHLVSFIHSFLTLDNGDSDDSSGDRDRSQFERLFAPIAILTGWAMVLLALLGIITHRIRYMNALQPLQWFYSTTFVVLLFEFWDKLDTILDHHRFGYSYSFDTYVFFAKFCTALVLFGTALTMPAELDLDFVHQYGYGYASAKHAMSPEAYASYLSWLFFSWFNKIISIGSSKTLNLSDLSELLPQLRARTVWSQFQMFSSFRSSASLLKRVLWFNGVSFLWQFTFVVISTFLDFSVPYFLKLFLSYINDPEVPPKVAYLYVILIFIAQVSRSLVQSQMFYMGRKINVSMMALLNAEIYAKTLTRRDMSGLVKKKPKESSGSQDSSDSNGKGNGNGKGKDKGKSKGKDDDKDTAPASAGKVVNLMSTDTVRVSGVCNFWHIGVSSPIGIALGTYLLYDLIGWSSLVGMSILIITIPVNKAVRKRYTIGQRELSSARDDRVTLMGEARLCFSAFVIIRIKTSGSNTD